MDELIFFFENELKYNKINQNFIIKNEYIYEGWIADRLQKNYQQKCNQIASILRLQKHCWGFTASDYIIYVLWIMKLIIRSSPKLFAPLFYGGAFAL